MSSPNTGAPGTIVFAHANGFPAGTYEVLFAQWRTAGWRVECIERFGHHPDYPVSHDWRRLRDELLEKVQTVVSERPAEPVVMVGHSLGGMLSLMTACKRPAGLAGLVILDAPVITGWRAQSLRLIKHSRLIHRVSPGKVSQRRRQSWPDRAAVAAHFAGKPTFARWDPRVLADYVRCGFDDEGGQVVLGFRREIETRIYNTLPHHLGALIKRHPPLCPVAFVAGTASAEMRQGGVQGAKALAGERFVWFEGTHLYPMERPDETAALVLELMAGFFAPLATAAS